MSDGEDKWDLPVTRNRRPQPKKSFVAAIAGLVIIIFATFYAYSYFLKSVRSEFVPARTFDVYSYLSAFNNTPPIVLLWTSYFSQSGKWLPSPASFKCPVSDCIVTDDRGFLHLSSAIVFHLRNVDLLDLPTYRTSRQRWILFNMEAPPHTPHHVFQELSGGINWTVSYRWDSDIYSPYGWLVRKNVSLSVGKPPSDRKLVCWLVSNCNTTSGRENFVRKLRKFIPVDIYGKCGDLQCPVEDRFQCYAALSNKYKFYLSFENSICKNYVTEKLFNVLRTNMVPVVMGGEDYRKILPPHSYIDALSFASPQRLAHYLQALDKHEGKYLSYLQWKRHYEVIDGELKWTCELCRKLHSNDTTIHRNLYRWWFEDEHTDCLPE